ncbi:hypothetical protein ACA910_000764 [Epithemia clementina (nom. ined.)]
MTTTNNNVSSDESKACATPFRLDLKTKKKGKEPAVSLSSPTAYFDGKEEGSGVDDETNGFRENLVEYDGNKASAEVSSGSTPTLPLVIPVVQNSGRTFGVGRLQNKSNNEINATKSKEVATPEVVSFSDHIKDEADAEAIRVLQQEAENPEESTNDTAKTRMQQDVVIEAPMDSFQQSDERRETEQYYKDMAALPDPMNVEDYKQSRVSIAEFGAAMLRGMGWTGEDQNNTKKDSLEPSLPRPHRLGLGAIPKLDVQEDNWNGASARRRPKTMEQYERDKKLRKQAQDFAQQRQKQVEMDRQQTLQIGSLVLLENGKRARICQLAGVPGLNQIKIQHEGERHETTVKRGIIDRLLRREELQEKPFVQIEESLKQEKAPTTAGGSISREKRSRDHGDAEASSKKHKRGEAGKYTEEQRSRSRHSSHRDDDVKTDKDYRKQRKGHEKSSSSASTWVIPQIRVRIVTDKLGRRYFKEKGIVVDVTRKGSTVELDESRVVLDRIPDRYLETALPKVGGRVVVLCSSHCTSQHLHSKGILLERANGLGVIQLDSDKSVLTLPLDDLAEWLGPIDDE